MNQKEGNNENKKLNVFRKDATIKTRLLNEKTFKGIDWCKVKIEKEWAEKNRISIESLPVIRRENAILPVWNLKRYAFLLKNEIPDTVNPKLWEQGKLNLYCGLFKVTENIYQVRGYDLANMSLIRGDTGWIVIGCLTSKETAEAALTLVNEHFKDIPVSAVIITHSHVDHYGGVLGVLDKASKENTKVYVPSGFQNAVIDENIYAGTAMSRRGIYMYGETLPRDNKGQIDCGIGKYVSYGTITLTNRLEEISLTGNQEYEEKIIDGITLQFQLTPNTEAPAEMNIYSQ